MWHYSLAQPKTCTNNGAYPPIWDTFPPEIKYHYFFPDAASCCERGGFDDECTVVDECSGESVSFAPLDDRDVLAGEDIPWIMDTNWHVDDSAEEYTLTNIPVEERGATSDLTLRVNVPHTATVTCTAKIDTYMPFDSFVILHGEEELVAHYFGTTDEMAQDRYDGTTDDGWMQISTELTAGDQEVTFRVQTAHFDAGFDRGDDQQVNDDGYFGTGRVWLKQCSISTHPWGMAPPAP
jgi:hypothetical protein